MKLLQKLLSRINGLHYPQEYLCLGKESMADILHVYLVNDQRVSCAVTHSHLFLGYHPLVFCLFDLSPSLQCLNDIDLIFSPLVLHPNEKFQQKDAIACLRLKKIETRTNDTSLIFFEGIAGSHRFLPKFRQRIISIMNRLNNKPGNVFLHDNLYSQVQIAYAIPRYISLITVGIGDRFNLFPTDLHGAAGDDLYIISLRHAGKACQQVQKAGQLLLSSVHSDFYQSVYSLGKNHMQELKKADNFPFSGDVSPHFGLPVPQSTLAWQELGLQASFVHGIHRLLLFKIVNRSPAIPSFSTLAHIHNAYATWRFNKGMAGNYLLR